MMLDYREALQKELKDPDFKQAWDSYELEYNLANLLIQLRSEAGLSQDELAKKIGTTQSAIARMESGKGHSTAGKPGKDRFCLWQEAGNKRSLDMLPLRLLNDAMSRAYILFLLYRASSLLFQSACSAISFISSSPTCYKIYECNIAPFVAVSSKHSGGEGLGDKERGLSSALAN